MPYNCHEGVYMRLKCALLMLLKCAFLIASKVLILDAFRMGISRCVKNAKCAKKKSSSTVCPRSLNTFCTVSYVMYNILLL